MSKRPFDEFASPSQALQQPQNEVEVEFQGAFGSLGLIEYFENDNDHIGVFASKGTGVNNLQLVFLNQTLRNSRDLCDFFTGNSTPSDSTVQFNQWISDSRSRQPLNSCYRFSGLAWTLVIHSESWIILRGKQTSQSINGDVRGTMVSQTSNMCLSDKERVTPLLPEPLSDHQRFAQDFDWASTPLGPSNQWPRQLRDTVNLVMTNPNPAALVWGKELIMIYNEAYLEIAGIKHPELMGKSPAQPFAEVWDKFFADRVRESTITKRPFVEHRLCLLLERLGYPEETYLSFSYIPLIGDDGTVVGFYHPVFEVTNQILAERRMNMLLKTSALTAGANDISSFWKSLLDSLGHNALDIPFAILYSLVDEPEDANKADPLSSRPSVSSRSTPLQKQCKLEGSIGFPASHTSISDGLSLEDSVVGFVPAFRSVLATHEPKLLQKSDCTLPENLTLGLETRGYTDQCHSVIVCPLQPTTHDNLLGFLVLGLASTRPYDHEYKLFVDLLLRQLQGSLTSVILYEEEKRRGRSAAEEALYQQTQLLLKLQKTSQETERMKTRYQLLAERAPVGIFEFSAEGKIIFANEAWYEITQHNRDDDSAMSWLSTIYEEDLPAVHEHWAMLVKDKSFVRLVSRFKKPWKAHGSDGEQPTLPFTWVLSIASPILSDDGDILGVTGTLTDITQQKWAVEVQTQRVQDMVEQRRQQEAFIDMTSHEMRNPLSALLQSAEAIDENLEELRKSKLSHSDSELIYDCIDSVKTILYCCFHEQNIIGDVLTLSKLDANLLAINPIEVSPEETVNEALKLFQKEARGSDVKLQFSLHPSYEELEIDMVFMDPSRFVQVLVNFIANALKFTKGQDVREMRIKLNGSVEKPTTEGSKLRFVSSGRQPLDPTISKSWGNGQVLYLLVSVQDTGPGLTEEEMSRLFARFSQTTPKTHAHYGGSGLGLFISQQLAELQGGEVGIASEVGVGSEFIFYVKVRRGQIRNRERNPSSSVTYPEIRKRKHTPSRSNSYTQISAATEVIDVKPTILIVEDNLVNQRVLTKAMKKLGYRISIANHGEEALAILKKSKLWRQNNGFGDDLDVVLMDVEMPIMDGRTCVRRIRELQTQDHFTNHVPVIAVTANARPEQISGAKGYGFDEVVSKPYKVSQLIQQIDALLKRMDTGRK